VLHLNSCIWHLSKVPHSEVKLFFYFFWYKTCSLGTKPFVIAKGMLGQFNNKKQTKHYNLSASSTMWCPIMRKWSRLTEYRNVYAF